MKIRINVNIRLGRKDSRILFDFGEQLPRTDGLYVWSEWFDRSATLERFMRLRTEHLYER